MPDSSAKSAYVVGVRSLSSLDGFKPNFNVFLRSPQEVDWAAGDGLAEPSVGEIAAYMRKQISKVNGDEVTLLTDSRLAGEGASEFALLRTVEKCSCMVRQTTITVAHGGMFYIGIFTAADKTTTAMAPILASLRSSWRWTEVPASSSTVSPVAASYTASDVLLTLADLPEPFQEGDGGGLGPVPAGGAHKLFTTESPYRLLMTQAVVWPDDGQAETYRARRARLQGLEIAELNIGAEAKALLPGSRMFAGIDQKNGKSYEWFRIVWRNGITVNEVVSHAAPEGFTQSDIIRLALKQAAHTRLSAVVGAARV